MRRFRRPCSSASTGCSGGGRTWSPGMVLEVRLTPETLIDRTEERKVFRSMFTPGSMLRIMKVAVPSGGGKSGLLKVFRDYCVLGTVTARAVLVDFADNRGNEALTPLDVARR